MKKSLSILLIASIPLSCFASRFNNVKIGKKRYDHTAVKAQNRARALERAAQLQQQAASATRTVVPVVANPSTGQGSIGTPSGDVYFMYCNGKKISFSGGQVPKCPTENTVFIKGCTDNRALNFNPDAKQNDGSCKYPVADLGDPRTPEILPANPGVEPVRPVDPIGGPTVMIPPKPLIPQVRPIKQPIKPIGSIPRPMNPQVLPIKQPIKPIAIKPVLVKPVKPIAIAPTKPIYVKPVRPVEMAPTKPIYVKPVRPIAIAPTKPVLVKPVKQLLVSGCKDSSAVNYNPKATVHDRNSCVYGRPAVVESYKPVQHVRPAGQIREPASFQKASGVKGIEF